MSGIETQTKEYAMSEALIELNSLVVSGMEFPDACYRVSCVHKVNYEDLADLYDAQF